MIKLLKRLKTLIMTKPLITQAMEKYYGIKEFPGPKNSPTILRWKREFWPDVKDDEEYAWCAVFMYNICKEFGYEHTKSALARDWLRIGEEIEEPEFGDVVIFSRPPEDWMGHVGFVVRKSDAHGLVYTFGGNQANQVNVRGYPISRVLGYRRLKRDV